jgi:Uma2 family endonuclease
VSDSSLEYDRTRKARVYSGAGIPEYWIVNLVESVLEVHRDPGRSGYRSVMTRRSGETVAPLVAPGAAIEVSELLP